MPLDPDQMPYPLLTANVWTVPPPMTEEQVAAACEAMLARPEGQGWIISPGYERLLGALTKAP